MGIRWTIPFVSLNETACHVDIYDNGWSGPATTLDGGADPFYYEENPSNNLLNDVIRYRTGYIRVWEKTNGALDDIYPTAKYDRYVEVYYGSRLEFNGYIQVQDFSQALQSAPKVVEFAVISPLGLFKTVKFLATVPPATQTIGDYLDTMLSAMGYSSIVVPNITGTELSQKIFSLAVTPWNTDYHHSMNVNPSAQVVKPHTYDYLIEGICKAFGWICHDTPGVLVFTEFLCDNYISYDVGSIGQSGSSVSTPYDDIDDFCIPADTQATQSILQPETGIEIDYEGSRGSQRFNLDRFYVPSTNGVIIMPSMIPYIDGTADAERYSLCNLMRVQQVNETGITSGFTFDANDRLNIGVGCVAWHGNNGIMISMSGSYPDGHELFWIRFYNRKLLNTGYSFRYDTMYRADGILSGLAEDEEINKNLTTVYSSTDDYIQFTFKYHYGGDIPQLPAQSLIFIYNIELALMEDGEPYTEYRYKPADKGDTIPATGNPAISSTLTMPISPYRLNDHMIGETVLGTKINTYPYLFAPRTEIRQRFRLTTPIADLFHAGKFYYLGRNWRVIAQAFYPWNDEYVLTLQYSSYL